MGHRAAARMAPLSVGHSPQLKTQQIAVSIAHGLISAPGRHRCAGTAAIELSWLFGAISGPNKPALKKSRSRSMAMRLPYAVLGLFAVLLLPMAGVAQYGTPFELRVTKPTARDAEPGAVPKGGVEMIPAVYRRQPVFYRTNEAPGTIIVDTSDRFLYLIQPNNIALRYGVGVGRDGFRWNGLLKITRKAEWPDWTPPPEMIERQPYLPRFMAGGPGNPMGARALYLGATIYRIHGTNAPETIGHAVSSGCFRLVNEEIMDLFERVPVGTKVVVQQ
jgi:lipoprotein-anchoring transpeptidase ErfK/SrfK